MNILEIYRKYTIPPRLQEHMLRVAAVSNVICRSYEMENLTVDTYSATAASLLHDMGNIVKFTFEKPIPGLYDDPGYRLDVQRTFIRTYGPEEHVATLSITKEITSDKRIHELVDSTGFTKASLYSDSNIPIEKLICCYADQRVSPFGIVSLEERLHEAKKRYENHPKYKNADTRSRGAKALHHIEQRLFQSVTLEPGDITDEACSNTIRELTKFSIS